MVVSLTGKENVNQKEYVVQHPIWRANALMEQLQQGINNSQREGSGVDGPTWERQEPKIL